MNNTLREHPLMRVLLDSHQRFRDGKIDVAGLQQNVSAVMGAMEGDIPKTVRDAVFGVEAELDSIHFTVNETKQAAEVEKLFSELEHLITKCN